MISSLYDAIKMDLDVYPLKKEDELKGYVKYLISKAYFGYNGDTNAQKYARAAGSSKVKQEVINLAKLQYYKAEMLLSADDLLKYASNAVVYKYNSELNKGDKNANLNSISSFNEVMQKMLSYYQEKPDYKKNYGDLDSLINFTKKILYNYFYRNDLKVFSSKNGTRAYVEQKNPSQILNEISQEIKMISNVPDAIISVYANKIAKSWMLKQKDMNPTKNQLNDVIDSIISEINHASLNDNQKKWLLGEFESGNVDALERYVTKDLIDKYKNLIELGNENYSK